MITVSAMKELTVLLSVWQSDEIIEYFLQIIEVKL